MTGVGLGLGRGEGTRRGYNISILLVTGLELNFSTRERGGPNGRRIIYDGWCPKGSTARGTLRWSGTEAQESKDIEALRLAYIRTEDKRTKEDSRRSRRNCCDELMA